MYGLIFAGILLAGASIAWIVDDSDDDIAQDTTDEPEVEEPEVEIGQNLLFDGSLVLQGTEGDDTLLADQDDSLLEPERIELLGGDDLATLDTDLSVRVFGGEGDDTLSSTSYGNDLYGGPGADVLSGGIANSMYGGEGNDQITHHMDIARGPGSTDLEGDEGDDTFTVYAGVGTDEHGSETTNFWIEGGEGEDSIELFLTLENDDVDIDGDRKLLNRLGGISDFDPEEDSLLIQIDAEDEAADREFETELEQEERDGRFYSTLTFTFLEDADIPDAREAVAVLSIASNAAFTLDDIQIVRV
jgi:Ca2+-binding RTX toxin-like protein